MTSIGSGTKVYGLTKAALVSTLCLSLETGSTVMLLAGAVCLVDETGKRATSDDETGLASTAASFPPSRSRHLTPREEGILPTDRGGKGTGHHQTDAGLGVGWP